jgi:hypothetical protein
MDLNLKVIVIVAAVVKTVTTTETRPDTRWMTYFKEKILMEKYFNVFYLDIGK